MCVFKGERDLRLDILASHAEPWARGGAPATKEALKEVAEPALPSASAEQVAKIAKLHARAFPSWRWRKICSGFPVRPKLIVSPALFSIGQHFGGFVDFFEFGFCRFVAWIYIGMVFPG